MKNYIKNQIFICFASEDRYTIVEPIVYNLNNYGFDVWYDRTSLLMGDNRIEKNLVEGACYSKYAVIIISENTAYSKCAMEEIKVIQSMHEQNYNRVFPVLYETNPCDLKQEFNWFKDLIFKEVTKKSGARDICNHIACRITLDYLTNSRFKSVQDIVNDTSLPPVLYKLLKSYLLIDKANFNSRITMLFCTYLIINELYLIEIADNNKFISKIFERAIWETKLNLEIDYRELWLLENALCLLLNSYKS